MKKRMFVVGIFNDAGSALDVIHELRTTTFNDDQLGFAVRSMLDEHTINTLAQYVAEGLPGVQPVLLAPAAESIVALEDNQLSQPLEHNLQALSEKDQSGIIVNCVIGGILGAIALLRLPDVGPVLAGGMLAAGLATENPDGMVARLLSIGIPEDKTPYYEQQLLTGNIMLIIKATRWQKEAQTVLHYHRACSVEVY